jgi:hypothetical protein
MSSQGTSLTLQQAKGHIVAVCGSCVKLFPEDEVNVCVKCGLGFCDTCPINCDCFGKPPVRKIVQRLRNYRRAA